MFHLILKLYLTLIKLFHQFLIMYNLWCTQKLLVNIFIPKINYQYIYSSYSKYTITVLQILDDRIRRVRRARSLYIGHIYIACYHTELCQDFVKIF